MDPMQFKKEFGVFPEALLNYPAKALVATWHKHMMRDQIVPFWLLILC